MALAGGLQRAIAAAKGGEEIKVLSAIRSDTPAAAMITKLVDDNTGRRFDARGNQTIETPNAGTLRQIAGGKASDITDVEHIFSVFPDLELAAMILISSILAPKDMVTTELDISLDMDIFQAELGADVLERFKTFFETSYKIKDQLYDIMYDTLFKTGSYPIAVLPENAIDEIINGHANFSNESHSSIISKMLDRRSVGILGPADLRELKTEATSTGLESFSSVLNRDYSPTGDYQTQIIDKAVRTNVHVIDNCNVLKLPELIESRQARARAKTLDDIFGIESRTGRRIIRARGGAGPNKDGLIPTHMDDATDQMSDFELRGLIYKHRHSKHAPIRVIPTQDQLRRRSVDEPLVMVFPSEAVIPCFVPGNHKRHVGYFVVIDKNGNPISRTGSPDLIEQFRQVPGNKKDFASSLLARTSLNIGISGFDCNDGMHRDAMVKTYTDIIEANLSARLRNGINSSSAKIATTQDVMQIMLARDLAGDFTQMLWIPTEIMTYFAIDFDSNGIGRSLISKSKNIFAMRAGLLFAEVAGGIKNSIGRTKVDVQLDEVDFDNDTSIELLMDKFMRTRQEMLPLSTLDPADLGNWIVRAGVEFSFTGGADVPEMKIDVSEHQTNYPKVEDKLSEMLEKTSFRALHITPEQIESLNQSDHATGIVNSNIMLSKRVIQHQRAFNPMITDHCQKRVRLGSRFITEIHELVYKRFELLELPDKIRERANEDPAVKETVVNMTVEDIVDSLVVELVPPKTTSLTNQLTEIEEYEKSLDKVLDNMFSEKILSADILGEFANSADNIKEIVKAYMIKKEMGRSGFMADVISDLGSDDKNSPMKEILTNARDFAKHITVEYSEHVKDMTKFRDDAETVAKNLDLNGSTGSTSTSDDTSTSSGDDDFGGGDPFATSGDNNASSTDDASNNDYPDFENDPDAGDTGKTEPEGGGLNPQSLDMGMD